jgi:hypothetical protein
MMAVTISPGMVVAPGDWDALFTQHGGIRPQADPSNVSPKPTDAGYLPRDKQQPVYRYFLADGSTVDARTSPDGTGWEIVEYKPAKEFVQAQTQAQRQEQPRQAPGGNPWKDDGPEAGATGRRWGWNQDTGLYDRDLGPSPAAQGIGTKPPQGPSTQQEAVPGYPGWTQATSKDAQGNQITVYYGPGSDTPQRSLPEKPAPPDKPQQSIQTITGGDGWPYTRIVTIGADGKPTITTHGPNGQPVASIPGEREQPKITQVRGEDGQVYTTITSIGPDNRVSVQTVDQRGNPVEKIPTKADKPDKSELREVDGELMEIIRDPATGTIKEMRPAQRATQTGNAGPPLPRVVVGMSVGALTDYKDQLAQEVSSGRQTQAWANARWGEAKDLATYAVQESTLLQREYETNLSASTQIAQSKLSHLNSGMSQALNFVLSINDKLPPNSPLGGRAFAAILGLNSINMARSGINDIKVGPVDTRGIVERGRASAGGGNGVPAPRPRYANPANGEAIEAQRQQAISDLRRETGVSNTTDAGGAAREYTPASSTGPGAVAPPAAAPAAAAAPPAPAPSPTGPSVVPGLGAAASPPPSGEQVRITNPVSGQNLQVPAANIDQFVGPGLGWQRAEPAAAPAPVGMADTPPAPSTPDLAVLANYRPQQQEAPMQTPPQAPPPMSMPHSTSSGQAPQPQIQIPEQQPIQVDPATGAEPLALIKQRLLSTPPWRLTAQDFALAQQYGLEDDAWQTPTQRLAV